VAEVIAAYWRHASRYYVKDGEASSELGNIKVSLRHLKALYADAPASEFGPLRLKAIRQTMMEADLSRGTLNRYTNHVRRCFKWAVSEGLVPPSVWHGLQAVDGLRKGRSEARETEPVRPVPDAYVEAIRPHVAPAVRAMVELMRLTGLRAGEVIQMRTADLAMGGAVWRFTPRHHKTEHHAHERVIDLGPRAQAVLRPWLKPDLEAYLFAPRDSEAARNMARREARTSPLTPSARTRRRRADRRMRARPPQECYTAASLRRAIARGVEKANEALRRKAAAEGREVKESEVIPTWHPHQLRHNFGTEIRKRYGLEVARVMLGHHSLGVAEVYAERDLAVAARVAAEVG
jgi:integrase